MKEGEAPTLDVRQIQDGTVFGPDPSTLPPAETHEAESNELPVVDPRHYKIIGEHARGGMGRVLIARDVRLGRLVAIKELLASEQEQGLRFLREVLLTARLQHPSIVPIHEAGQWPNGKPFYAMKLVSGRPLGELIRGAKTLADRLALLRHIIDVSEAISYAHSVRIIHRDLKPSNVIVGDFGETVVIDWGLAKDISDETAPDRLSAHTVQGAVVGTPGFMPPEQAFGRAVDERADVYALGSLLYTLLAGRHPYDGTHAPALMMQVKLGGPVPLSQRDPAIPPDLCAIVDKAMARNPDERYFTALGLAEDLRRFETGQLVAARAYSRTELLRRWLRRNRFVVTVIAVAAAAVVAFVGVGVVKIVAERDRADRERTEAVGARQRAEAARARDAGRVDELTLVQARAYINEDPTAALAWLKRLRPRPENAKATRQAMALAGHEGAVSGLAFPEPDTVVSAGDDATVRVWSLRDKSGRILRGHEGGVTLLLTSRGGRIATYGHDRQLRLWNLATGEGRMLRLVPSVGAMAFSPSGRVLALSEQGDRQVHFWAGDEVRSYLEREPVSQLAFVDDDLLVVGGSTGSLWLRSPRGGAVPLLGHRARVGALRVFPRAGAATIASLGDDETMRIWTDPVPTDADALRAWLDRMTSAAVGPDDRVAGSEP